MIIGRKREQELLGQAYKAHEAQFLTVYGRRRIGKTFLIREFFLQKKCHFLHVTGLQKGTMKKQLENFAKSLSKTFFNNAPLRTPPNWSDALSILTDRIMDTQDKVVIFFDELPWLATRRSGLMEQIDFYWNNRWAGMHNVIFIACGSSASWLLTNIIYNKGGLHNRTTLEMHLRPFDLAETREYLRSMDVQLNDRHITSLYMAVGGIPYYLNYIKPDLGAQENIQLLFFDPYAPLNKEYDKLFESLFDGAAAYKEIIAILAQKKGGLSRSELDAAAKLSTTGGLLSKRLKDLSDAGFIQDFIPWGKELGQYYKVIDEFCLFYIQWIASYSGSFFDNNYWAVQSQRPTYYAWAGYAFEALCVKHYHQIIRALGIRGASGIGSWRFVPRNATEKGAQIDLVIDRLDDAMTLCEIKYTEKPFVIDKSYAAVLENKLLLFKKHTKTTKQLFLSMICANGLKKTIYSEELISGVVTLEDLFKPY